MNMTAIKSLSCLAVLAIALLWQWCSRPPPRPADPLVAEISDRFQALLGIDGSQSALKMHRRGVFNWDLDTFVWSRLSEKFGSNPNTPYMYSTLSLGGILPSPMWRLQHDDAVVLIFRRPPPAEYFSFTTFCLGSFKRGLVFSSLGDSLNSHSDMMADTNKHKVFAHVVVTEGSRETLRKVQEALVESGVSEEAIHVAVVPNTVAQDDSFSFYEVVLRLFRFHNQTEGDAYLQSKQPVFYIKGLPTTMETNNLLPKPTYKDRSHPDTVDEPALYKSGLHAYQHNLLDNLNQTFDAVSIQPINFSPLYIIGLNCLDNIGHQCLGDCPDAAYFGSNIVPTSDNIESLTLPDDNEFHLVTMIDHRKAQSSIYSSIALLKTQKAILNKTKLDVRATSIGVLSNHEYHPGNNDMDNPFFSWIFTRNPDHCRLTRQFVKGCTMIDEKEVSRDSYFAYCERLYLNPVTGTGPDWNTVLPAQMFHFENVQTRPTDPGEYKRMNAALFAKLRLPSSNNVELKVFRGEERLKFLHIIKTGGESLERYAWNSPMGPYLDYAHCRRASVTNLTASLSAIPTAPCWAVASAIGVLLCGLNCECCAGDFYRPGGFHGTLLRSPRSHTLSLFSHGHQAHHTTWRRMASDLPLYAAEGFLRGAELLCGHSGTDGVSDWKVALEENLKTSLSVWPPNTNKPVDEGVQVISLRNTQSHSLTCGKSSRGSMGQHFRVLPTGADALDPRLEEALAALNRMEWVGVTDLFHPSLCMLHYQANRTLPAEDCDCRHPQHHVKNRTNKPLGYWVEGRTTKRSIADLSREVIDLIDAHTGVDSKLFAAALRLVLGRLRRVEELTGASILECIDWQQLKRKTDYIPGLWSGGSQSFLPN